MSRLHWLESGRLVIQHGHLWYYVLVPMSVVLLLTIVIFSQIFHPLVQMVDVLQSSTQINSDIFFEIKNLAMRSVMLVLPYLIISFLLVFFAFLSLIRAIYAVYLNKKFKIVNNLKKTARDMIPSFFLFIVLSALTLGAVQIVILVIQLELWWLNVIVSVISALILISAWFFSYHFFIIKQYNIFRSIWESIKLVPFHFYKIFETYCIVCLTLLIWICLFANVYFFGTVINIYLGFFWGIGSIIIFIPIMLLIMIYLSLVFFSVTKL